MKLFQPKPQEPNVSLTGAWRHSFIVDLHCYIEQKSDLVDIKVINGNSDEPHARLRGVIKGHKIQCEGRTWVGHKSRGELLISNDNNHIAGNLWWHGSSGYPDHMEQFEIIRDKTEPYEDFKKWMSEDWMDKT